MNKVKKYLNTIEYNDYDRIVQIADMFSRGKEILSIRERLDKNKAFYHTQNLSYENSVFELRDSLNKKFNIDIEKIVDNIFKPKERDNIIWLPKIWNNKNAYKQAL